MALFDECSTLAQKLDAIAPPPGLPLSAPYAAKVDITSGRVGFGMMGADPYAAQAGSSDAWLYPNDTGLHASKANMNDVIGCGQQAAVLDALLTDRTPAVTGEEMDKTDWQHQQDDWPFGGLHVVGHERMLAMQQMQLQMHMQMQMQMQMQMHMQAYPFAHQCAWQVEEPLAISIDEASGVPATSALCAHAMAFQPCDAGLPDQDLEEDSEGDNKAECEHLQRGGGSPWPQASGSMIKPRLPGRRPGVVNRQVQTLSSSLQALCHEDPDCLFIVRRINKLGFKACRTLKHHFASQGHAVVRVLVAHSTVRQHGDAQGHARRRPSSLGFVQMASAGAVRKLLALGPEHVVDGHIITVQQFERKQDEELFDEEVDNAASSADALPMRAKSWGGRRSYSEVTTSTTAGSTSSCADSDNSDA